MDAWEGKNHCREKKLHIKKNIIRSRTKAIVTISAMNAVGYNMWIRCKSGRTPAKQRNEYFFIHLNGLFCVPRFLSSIVRTMLLWKISSWAQQDRCQLHRFTGLRVSCGSCVIQPAGYGHVYITGGSFLLLVKTIFTIASVSLNTTLLRKYLNSYWAISPLLMKNFRDWKNSSRRQTSYLRRYSKIAGLEKTEKSALESHDPKINHLWDRSRRSNLVVFGISVSLEERRSVEV